jgi:hypothetical protein
MPVSGSTQGPIVANDTIGKWKGFSSIKNCG